MLFCNNCGNTISYDSYLENGCCEYCYDSSYSIEEVKYIKENDKEYNEINNFEKVHRFYTKETNV